MKGLKLRTVVALFCLVLTLAGVLVAQVWKQNAYVRISMGAVKLAKEEAQLRNEIALLEVSVGGLKKISRIEAMAKGRFGLEYGKAPVLVYLDGEDRASRKVAPAGTQTALEARIGGINGLGQGLPSGKVEWRTSGL
jgi:hypothetical protein